MTSAARRRPVIVVGYDGSEPSRAALVEAARRAGASGRVFVVHAYDLPPDFLGSPNYEQLLAERRDHGRALLAAMPLPSDEALLDTDYETELIGGPPAHAIADVARARDADEIVVGARGHGRIRALLGSVSHELLHIADRPVLVIPAAALQSRHRPPGAAPPTADCA
ncbi:MAG: universal stress protein [Solirubrobacteraceae bacterium]|jgi:nucleotide-binding universal stress UspA family protein